MENLEKLKDFIGWLFRTYAWRCIWIIPLLLLLYGIVVPERLEKWSSWFYKFFSWISRSFQRRFIATDIQSRINSSLKSINSELEGVAPYGIKVRWVNTKEITREGFIKGDNVVVMMRQHINQDENLALACLIYSSLGVLSEARPYILPKISRSLDLSVAKKVLMLGNKPSALNHFIKSLLQPEKNKDGEVKQYSDIMESLDEFGILTRIFMAELLGLSGHLYPRLLGNGNILTETQGFLFYCKRIAERKISEEIELDFNGDRLRVSVIMVAKAYKREFLGTRSYIGRFKRCASNDSDFIYFYGWKRINIAFVRKIVEEIEKLKLGTKMSESIFSAFTRYGRVRAICVRIKVAKELIREPEEPNTGSD